MKNLSRRDFANLILKLAILCSFPFRQNMRQAFAASNGRSKVVRITNPKATANAAGKDDVDINKAAVREMIETGLKAFTGKATTEEAWTEIIPDPNKKVAVKVNCQITGIYTKSTVVNAVLDGVIRRGVPPSNIVIYDLTDNAFTYAGFKKNRGEGIKVGTISELGGFSWFHWLGNPLFDPDVRICKVLAGEGKYGCDYLINIPVLKALDGWAGVSLSMKNHFGSISNPAGLHATMHSSIAKLNAHPLIMKKTKLIVLDGTYAGIKWFNGRNQDHVVANNQLLFGTDSVAIDYLGWQSLEALRKKIGLPPLEPKPDFIKIASEDYALGNNNPQQIDLIDI